MIDKHNPQRYLQDAGIAEMCRPWLDESSLIVTGKRAWQGFCDQLDLTDDSGNHPHFVAQADEDELTRIVAADRGCQRVLCIGGGRAIDLGKAVATTLEKPSVVVPTVFSTDAPCSSLSVIYDATGQPSRYLDHKQNPQCVVVDTDLLGKGPERYLRAGLAGSLSVFYETEEIFAARRFHTANVMDGHVLMSAQWAKQRLLRLSEQLVEDRATSETLRDIYFICFWMTADCFEHVGISLPHTIYRLLRGMGLSGVEGYLHGELVGLGLICQTLLCPTHRVESPRIEALVGRILKDVDWTHLENEIQNRRDDFYAQADRWPVDDNISAPLNVDAVYNCVLDVLGRRHESEN